MSLPDINIFALNLLNLGTDDSIDDFIRLMVAGRVPVEGITHRVLVNPFQDIPDHLPRDITITGDYDSLIGFTPNLPFKFPLAVYPVPPFNFTLKKNIHLTLDWTAPNVCCT